MIKDGKSTEKTEMQYEIILSAMEPGVWYQASEFMEILELKESRTRELFRELVAMNSLEDNGATKGKKYRKL